MAKPEIIEVQETRFLFLLGISSKDFRELSIDPHLEYNSIMQLGTRMSAHKSPFLKQNVWIAPARSLAPAPAIEGTTARIVTSVGDIPATIISRKRDKAS